MNGRSERTPVRVARYLVLAAGAVIMVGPFLYLLSTSFKPQAFALTIPPQLLEALEWRSHDPDAVLQLGVSYATLQCAELLARGAPGVHFYTLNKSHATRAIL